MAIANKNIRVCLNCGARTPRYRWRRVGRARVCPVCGFAAGWRLTSHDALGKREIKKESRWMQRLFS